MRQRLTQLVSGIAAISRNTCLSSSKPEPLPILLRKPLSYPPYLMILDKTSVTKLALYKHTFSFVRETFTECLLSASMLLKLRVRSCLPYQILTCGGRGLFFYSLVSSRILVKPRPNRLSRNLSASCIQESRSPSTWVRVRPAIREDGC